MTAIGIQAKNSYFLICLVQRFIWPGSESIIFDIVSRCFRNKNNNCCETKICKNAICLLITNLQIQFWQLCGLDVLAAEWQDYCFYFQNIWIQCRMWRIVLPVKQIFESSSWYNVNTPACSLRISRSPWDTIEEGEYN